jgi:hypothetical protein
MRHNHFDLRLTFAAQLLFAARDMISFNRPASKDYKSVFNYIWGANPLIEEERAWIDCREDLITLRPGREHAWIDWLVEYLLIRINYKPIQVRQAPTPKLYSLMEDLRLILCFKQRFFCSEDKLAKAHELPITEGRIIYFTSSRIDRLVAGIIVFMLMVLLIIPIYLLYHFVARIGHERTDAICMGILLVFTLAFAGILWLFTKAKRHEILAAAAGYCAVLVVFLGNVNGPNNSAGK